MKKAPVFVLTILLSATSSPTLAQGPSRSEQIAAAVLPLPMPLREGAGVLRWSGPGETEQLRASENGMSCVADNPSDERFDVRCYHDEFWVLIRRARQLARTLESGDSLDAQMRREIDAGQLQLPSAPTAGYRMLGPISAYNRETNEAGPEIRKWQSIHFPFDTADDMGLPEAPEENAPAAPGLMPFVMASGTWWSHVMIVHEPFQ